MLSAAIASLAIVALYPDVSAEPSLKVYSGAKPDTVYKQQHTIVCVTEPGATATVGGKEVHVYKTGSFGASVELTPGENIVKVTSTLGGATSSVDIPLYYSEKAPAVKAKAKNAEEENTLMFDSPRYVTTLPGAYLQYGNGDDRLGGSKMGFLDSCITLKAVGCKGSLYCVRLAADRIAYVPRSYVKPAAEAGTPVVNTGSWSISNMGDFDRVSISLPRRLPYQYVTEISPNAISVDLFGATDNSNWMTLRSLDLGIIDFVEFRQVSEDVYRMIIRLKGKAQWGFHVSYDKGGNLMIDVRHAPKSLQLKDLVIGLDAGHGGEYPGAISPSGIKEKDVNLDIVKRIKTLLERRGAKVVMTREGDTGPSMAERKRIWLDGDVDIAISVHNNSGGSPLSSPGTAVLYKHLANQPFAMCLARRMVQTGLPLFGVVGNFNFSLNGPTEYPNALIEGMFMSSLEEEEKLADASFRQQVAEKIVAGLEDYLRSCR